MGVRWTEEQYQEFLNARSKDHTAVPAANAQQDKCNVAARKDAPEKVDKVCRIHVHSRRRRLADSDGISAKAAIDGLVLGGLLLNDSPREVELTSYSQEKIGGKDQESTEVTITW